MGSSYEMQYDNRFTYATIDLIFCLYIRLYENTCDVYVDVVVYMYSCIDAFPSN